MSDTNEELIGRLLAIFEDADHEWKIGGVYQRPTEEAVRHMLSVIADRIKGDTLQYESGGLIVQNNNNHLDVYVFIGEYEPLDIDVDNG